MPRDSGKATRAVPASQQKVRPSTANIVDVLSRTKTAFRKRVKGSSGRSDAQEVNRRPASEVKSSGRRAGSLPGVKGSTHRG